MSILSVGKLCLPNWFGQKLLLTIFKILLVFQCYLLVNELICNIITLLVNWTRIFIVFWNYMFQIHTDQKIYKTIIRQMKIWVRATFLPKIYKTYSKESLWLQASSRSERKKLYDNKWYWKMIFGNIVTYDDKDMGLNQLTVLGESRFLRSPSVLSNTLGSGSDSKRNNCSVCNDSRIWCFILSLTWKVMFWIINHHSIRIYCHWAYSRMLGQTRKYYWWIKLYSSTTLWRFTTF